MLEVAPELLADALRRIVADRGLAVTRRDEVHRRPADTTVEEATLEADGADVAVVCGFGPDERPPEDVGTDTAIYLPGGDLDAWETTTEVLVVRPSGRDKVEVADLEGLVDLIVELATDC